MFDKLVFLYHHILITAIICPDSRNRTRLEHTLPLIPQGQIKVTELVTERINLAKAPEAYQMLLDPHAEFLGMVIAWK